MITSIIFSKNRPLQLDLCLNSIKKNFTDTRHQVVIHNNSDSFKGAHDILCGEHPDVEFRTQGRSLFKDIYETIASTQDEYICFLTDDNICYLPCPNIDDFLLPANGVSCVALRMGLNICERGDTEGGIGEDRCRSHQELNEMIAWPKTLHCYGSYWSYDLSVDGHIFRKDDMLQMADELCYLDSRYKWNQNPNEFEGALQRFWTTAPNVMIAPKHSTVVNSPNNRVQQSHDNRSGDLYRYDENYLLGKYMAGNRINLDHLNFGDIKCPHTEINLMEGMK